MKKSTRKLRDKLKEAFEVQGFRYFLNKKTMEVISYPDHEAWYDTEFIEANYTEVTNNPDDFLEIRRLSNRELYILMEDFIETVGNKHVQGLLMEALNRKTAFRQFRYVLEDTHMLDKWLDFKNHRYNELAERWIDDNIYQKQTPSSVPS